MTRVQELGLGGLVVLAGLALVPARPAVADGVSDSLLRAQSHAIGSAIGGQMQVRHKPAYPDTASVVPVQSGNQMVMSPQGATLHAGPGPGTPVLDRLNTGAPVLVTRPVGSTGWVEVLSGGQFGYVWAPQLTPQGLPAAPWEPPR